MKRLNELDENELKQVFDKNNILKSELYDKQFEMQMDMQEDIGKYLMGSAEKYIRICDNYNSFYLKLVDGIKFLENINLENLKDYNITTDKEIKEYKKALNYYYHCNYGSDRFYDWEEKIENIAKGILKELERYLHEFEDIDEAEVFEMFVEDISEGVYRNYYIKDNDYIVYEDVAYTRKLA